MAGVARSSTRIPALGGFPRTACAALALALVAGLPFAGLAGCAAIDHGLRARDFAGEALSPHTARGAERLRAEMDVDASVARYVAEHGRPDYLYVVDRQRLYLFYVERDGAAKFERVLVEASTVEELGRIPGSLMKHLPAEARARLERQRSVEQRRAQARAKRSKAEQARRGPSRSGPASRAPGGTTIGGFDAREIVARMRTPVTAADPGVSDWSQGRLRSGGEAWSGRAGRARYEVSAERVAFTTPISASRKQLPGSARVAIQRINAAIFAHRAEAVTQRALEMAERAAADRTGRTRFEQRVAGRTIRIGRLGSQGVFAYSVHP